MTRVWSQYYTPRSKKDLLQALLPTWKGSKTDLREMSVKRLKAIFHRVRSEAIGNLLKKSLEETK